MKSFIYVAVHTPLTILVPSRVTNPFRLSDRGEDITRVEPRSLGANSAAHSRSPPRTDESVSCKELNNQSSSRAYGEKG